MFPTPQTIDDAGDAILSALVLCAPHVRRPAQPGDLVIVAAPGLDWERVGWLLADGDPIHTWSCAGRVVRWRNASVRPVCYPNGAPIRRLRVFPRPPVVAVLWAHGSKETP